MVHFHNTAVTNRAMMGSFGLDAFTFVAFINNLKLPLQPEISWQCSKIKIDEITWSGRLLASRTDSSVSGIFSHTPGSERKLKLLSLKPEISNQLISKAGYFTCGHGAIM